MAEKKEPAAYSSAGATGGTGEAETDRREKEEPYFYGVQRYKGRYRVVVRGQRMTHSLPTRLHAARAVDSRLDELGIDKRYRNLRDDHTTPNPEEVRISLNRMKPRFGEVPQVPRTVEDSRLSAGIQGNQSGRVQPKLGKHKRQEEEDAGISSRAGLRQRIEGQSNHPQYVVPSHTTEHPDCKNKPMPPLDEPGSAAERLTHHSQKPPTHLPDLESLGGGTVTNSNINQRHPLPPSTYLWKDHNTRPSRMRKSKGRSGGLDGSGGGNRKVKTTIHPKRDPFFVTQNSNRNRNQIPPPPPPSLYPNPPETLGRRRRSPPFPGGIAAPPSVATSFALQDVTRGSGGIPFPGETNATTPTRPVVPAVKNEEEKALSQKTSEEALCPAETRDEEAIWLSEKPVFDTLLELVQLSSNSLISEDEHKFGNHNIMKMTGIGEVLLYAHTKHRLSEMVSRCKMNSVRNFSRPD